MREPMTDQRLREAQEVAWSPVYRPTADFPEHVYRHDLLRDAVSEIERLRGTVGAWRSTLVALHNILAEHRIMMQIDRDQAGPPKLVTDLMQWLATTVERETHGQRERAEQAEGEAARLREQLAEATTLLGCFVDHEDGPCRFDHHGACQEHSGSGLRRCDVAAGRELLARNRGVGERSE
jgi:hypothetical protein